MKKYLAGSGLIREVALKGAALLTVLLTIAQAQQNQGQQAQDKQTQQKQLQERLAQKQAQQNQGQQVQQKQVQQKQLQDKLGQKEEKVFVFDDFGGRESAPILQAKPGSPPPPRLRDGHIDLGNGKGSWNAVVIKDISGNGLGDQSVENPFKRGPQLVEKKLDVPMLPWAKKFVEDVDKTLSRDDPEARCLPPGIPRMNATPFPFQIYQLPDRLMFLYEGGAHMWHIVYTDGRKHSKDATDYPTYLGEGIGRWDKDTMVIDNIGFNDKSWLDAAGHPHTEKLHVVERYTRTSLDNMHYEATIDDPATYTKPWTTSWNIQWLAGATPLEYICQEGNQDVQHLVGISGK